jgi:hypothetical protein
MSQLCGNIYTPLETEINTQLDFSDGIALAVLEENKQLSVLAELLDNIRDVETALAVQRIINKKITNRNMLSFIKNNFNYPFRL